MLGLALTGTVAGTDTGTTRKTDVEVLLVLAEMLFTEGLMLGPLLVMPMLLRTLEDRNGEPL